MRRGSTALRHLDFFFGIPVLRLCSWFRRCGRRPQSPRRIGMLFNPALGDTLLASAAVEDVRALYPDAHLIVFATAANVAAARLLPGVGAIEMLRIPRPLRSIRVLRQARLDMLLDFTAWQRSTAIYTMLSHAAFTMGFERTGQHRHIGYDQAVPHRGDCHELENLRRLTRALGATTPHEPRLQIPNNSSARRLLNPGQRYIVLHAWASGSKCWMREWPAERWIELVRRLKSPSRVFLLTGSSADEPCCDALFQTLRDEGATVRTLIGREGLAAVAGTLLQAEMLISVNTGILHLGAILGVPTIALNGPTSAARWGAVGPRVANVAPADGSGGYLDLGFEYRGRTENVMAKITVDQVLDVVNALLPDSAAHAERARELLREQESLANESQPQEAGAISL